MHSPRARCLSLFGPALAWFVQLVGQYAGAAVGAAAVGGACAILNRRAGRTGPWPFAQLGAVAIAAMLGGQMGAVYPTMLTSRSLLTMSDSTLAEQARIMLRRGALPHHESLRKRHAEALRAYASRWSPEENSYSTEN